MKTTRNLKQVGTWWASSPDGFGGNTFAAPVAIKCRWEDKREVIPGARNLAGGIDRETVSNTTVYLDRDVAIGDYLALGDQTASNDPTTVVGALKVQLFEKVTDLRNVESLRQARL